MACRAVEARVHPREGESSQFQVIEFRPQPGIDGVALLALDGEAGGHVIGFGGLLIGALVARVTLDGKSLELPHRLAFMTVRTIQSGMSSHQWEAVVVFPYPLQNDAPPFNRVALFAVGSHLAAMNVSVAVRTIRSGVRENGFGMTLCTSHSLVLAT